MLEEETKHFESIKEGLLEHHKGKFALIIGSELLGVFDTAEKAYETGIGAHGNVPMLIKPILEHEPVESMPALTLGLLSANPQ